MAIQELHATGGAVRLSQADRDAYRADGALIVRGLIGEAARESVADDLERLVWGMERLLGLPAQACADNGAMRVADLSRRLLLLMQCDPTMQSVVYDAMSHAPALHTVAAFPTAMDAVRQLLSDDVAIHERLILLMSPPENQWHLPLWHQDWFYNEGPQSTLTLYVPLQRTTALNGSLLVALGEHGRGLLPHGDFDHGITTKWRTIDPEVIPSFRRVVDTELEAGDALVFNSLVPHSARINRSSDFRFVINLRYRDLRDPEFRAAHWRIGRIDRAREALSRAPQPLAGPHAAVTAAAPLTT